MRRKFYKSPERPVQRGVIDVLDRFYQEGFVFHIPNGGYRRKRDAKLLQGDGVKAGIPDLGVVRPFGAMGWVENKAQDGVISDEQFEMADHFRLRGHKVYVVYDVEAAYELVKIWKKEDAELRAKLGWSGDDMARNLFEAIRMGLGTPGH